MFSLLMINIGYWFICVLIIFKLQEEMDKHPFFMKSTPEDGALSPLAEGLAKLKYDPEENTPLELAANYKEDGNFNFKHKNYRLAILG